MGKHDSDSEGSDTEMSGNRKDAVNAKKKGRGFSKTFDEDRNATRGNKYDRMDEDDEESKNSKGLKSVEGWIVFVTGIHEEAQEDDVYEAFADYGEIKQIHLNLDRRTGYVKGYALVEYESFKEAQAAIEGTNGTQLLEQEIHSDWAFTRPNKRGAR